MPTATLSTGWRVGIFGGWQVAGAIGAVDNPHISQDLGEYVRADLWPPSESAATEYDSNLFTTAIPINQPAAGPVTGWAVWSWLRDYYYRVHVVPNFIRLGPIVRSTEQQIEVWSAWFQDNTLNAIQKTGTGGLTLTGPVAPPTTFLPLDSRMYTLTVDVRGPATVDALYTFDFALNDPTLRVVGGRVLPWPFSPDWTTAPRERLEWRTNVIRSHDVKERRAQTRDSARLVLEYDILQDGDLDRVVLENLLHGWQSRVFGVPLWHQQEYLAAELAQGATVVPVDTTSVDYRVGGLAAFVNGPHAVELIEILAVDPGQLTLVTGTGQVFPVGSKVAPARYARLRSDARVTYLSDGIPSMVVQFQGTDEEVHAAAVEADDYRGYPVLLDRRDWTPDVEAGYRRFTTRVDFDTGLIGVDDRAEFQGLTRSHAYVLDGRAAIAAFRAFLAARSGRRLPVWVPSGHSDFKLLGTAGATDTSLVVENRRHTQLVETQTGRRDVMVWLNDGTRFYRRIVGGTIDSPEQETLELNSPLGQSVPPSGIRQISYMALARLSADAVELAHETDAIARAQIEFEALRDDVP